MESPIPTLVITALYLIMIRVGPRMMENHKPLELKNSMILYNFACVVLSGYIVIEHVYHHASMFVLWWIGIKWVAGGQGKMSCRCGSGCGIGGGVDRGLCLVWSRMNSFIHVVMYSYYCIAAMGQQFHKYLWWKKYLTMLQFVQFCLGMVHAINSLTQCPSPLDAVGLIGYATSMFLLFANFYLHAYIKGERLPKAQLKLVRASEKNGTKTDVLKNGADGDGVQNGRGKGKSIGESKKVK
nr:elongation of very long chain fatty acids protein 4-like [Lytechinus pictus]